MQKGITQARENQGILPHGVWEKCILFTQLSGFKYHY